MKDEIQMLIIIAAIASASLGLTIFLSWKLKKRFANLDHKLQATQVLQSRTLSICHQLAEQIPQSTLEIQNSVATTSLDLQYPVFLGEWSVDSFFFRYISQFLIEKKPSCIVELGSGSSTLIIASLLAKLSYGDVKHIAVDHEARYLSLTRNLAIANGLSEGTQYLHRPLSRDNPLGMLWYDDLASHLPDQPIDLLIVDAPPGPIQPLSRYPALPILHEQLSDSCTIILDDANRNDETTIMQKWKEEFPGFSAERVTSGHGLAIFSPDAPHPND